MTLLGSISASHAVPSQQVILQKLPANVLALLDFLENKMDHVVARLDTPSRQREDKTQLIIVSQYKLVLGVALTTLEDVASLARHNVAIKLHF